MSACITELPGEFPHQEELCRTDSAREQQRAASAANFPAPQITALSVNGNTSWTAASNGVPLLTPGDEITLTGTNIDFSKIMIGNNAEVDDLVQYLLTL